MQLPAALQSWSAELELFAADLRWPLGGLVQKLASVVGPLAVSHSAWDGEPDGFDGLARRGPYDRLLATEWLLAEEAPDEFVRRAAMSEHVFLRLARPEPAGDRLTIALFDAGPSQLGTPRLVHVALLILLARRAEAARARFGWGIVQEPDAPLGAALDEAAVTRLLEARTPDVPSADHVAAWTGRIGSWKRLDECWWIGGRRSRAWSRAAPRGRDRGRVPARPAARGGPGADPGTAAGDRSRWSCRPDDACTRLLRDPFARALAPIRPVEAVRRPESNLVFSWDGNKVFSRLGQTRVLAYAIPNSPRGTVGAPKTYETYRSIMAIGRHRRAILAATRHPTGLLIQKFGKDSAVPHAGFYTDESGHFDARSWPEAMLRPLWIRPEAAQKVHAMMVDERDRLFALTMDLQGLRLRVLADKVLAATWWDGALLIAERATHMGQDGVWLSKVGERVEPLGLLAMEAEGVLFGYRGRGGSDPSLGPLAFNPRGREWCLRSRDRQLVLIAPAGSVVLGVGLADGKGEPGLIVLLDDRRTITLLGRNWERGLARASSPIEHATVESAHGLMAYTTHDELVVFRLDTRVVLLRKPLA